MQQVGDQNHLYFLAKILRSSFPLIWKFVSGLSLVPARKRHTIVNLFIAQDTVYSFKPISKSPKC